MSVIRRTGSVASLRTMCSRHDQRHRPSCRGLEGRGLLRLERASGRVGGDPARRSSTSPTSSAGRPTAPPGCCRARGPRRSAWCWPATRGPWAGSRSTWSSSPAWRASSPSAGTRCCCSSRPTSADELELYPQWWSERRVDGVVVVDIRRRRSPDRALRRAGDAGRVRRRPGHDGRLHHRVDRRRHGDGRGRPRTWPSWAIDGSAGWPARPISATPRCGTSPSREAVAAVRACTGDDRARRLLRAAGGHATRELWQPTQPPTVILFDNDLMAIAGLSDADRAGGLGARSGQPAGLGRLRAVRDHPPEAVRHEPRRDGLRRARRSAAVRPARRRRAGRVPRLHPGAGGAREHRPGPCADGSGRRPGRSGGDRGCSARPAARASGTRRPRWRPGRPPRRRTGWRAAGSRAPRSRAPASGGAAWPPDARASAAAPAARSSGPISSKQSIQPPKQAETTGTTVWPTTGMNWAQEQRQRRGHRDRDQHRPTAAELRGSELLHGSLGVRQPAGRARRRRTR